MTSTRIAYFDCFSGAAGDMILGALVDAGCPLERLQAVVAGLNLPGVLLSAERVKRGGIAATQIHVHVGPESRRKHRHLPEIQRIIGSAPLSADVAARALETFQRLAEAEAAVHGTAVDKVHFHEVGAADAIVDIVCASAALSELGIAQVVSSPIPPGNGTVTCEHGVMPVPAPATAMLLRGVPLADTDEQAELTTPTGAAVLTTVASRFGVLPAMRIERVGYGAGSREGRTRPNLLRVLIGALEAQERRDADSVVVLEAQLDDMNGQALGFACERLLEAGALDVYTTPIMMKKGRPGQLLTVLGRPEAAATLESVVLRETTTFGVRRHACERTILQRERVSVATPFGDIRVKVGRQDLEVLRGWPEYDDCAAAARRAGVTLQAVQEAALQAWRANSGCVGGPQAWRKDAPL